MNQSVSIDTFSLFAIGLALVYAFCNGFRDAATISATVVSTRALTPTVAFALCAIAEFLGASLIGAGVASTISKTILVQGMSFALHSYVQTLCVGLSVAMGWGMVCWWRGWPTSNGHALLAGLMGAAMAIWGPDQVHWRLAGLVFLVLIVSPMLGFALAVLITGGLRWVGERLTTRARMWGNGLHVMSCLSVAAAHGSNDGQLVVGALLPLMNAVGGTPIPSRILVAMALSAGVLVGGRRLLKKLSLKFYRIRDPQGLGAELTAAATIFSCGLLGFPASTTQVVAGSIVGAGVAQNARRVKWDFAQEMVMSWIVTFPVVCLLAFLVMEALLAGGW